MSAEMQNLDAQLAHSRRQIRCPAFKTKLSALQPSSCRLLRLCNPVASASHLHRPRVASSSFLFRSEDPETPALHRNAVQGQLRHLCLPAVAQAARPADPGAEGRDGDKGPAPLGGARRTAGVPHAAASARPLRSTIAFAFRTAANTSCLSERGPFNAFGQVSSSSPCWSTQGACS